MIKAYSVRLNDEQKKTIDTHLKIEKELESRNLAAMQAAMQPQEGFVEGLKAVVVETLPSEEDAVVKSSQIIEDARNQAEQILEEAKQEAEKLKNDASAAAQKKGYEEGMLQIKKEAQKLKSEYEEKNSRLKAEYENLTQSLEPQMAQLIADLVEKITGIVVADKEEIILYLINKAIRNMDKSAEYTIKVSKEDYEYVSEHKDSILEALDREILLYITEDANLGKNQCLIETELKVINCSLDIQLSNLITDLKLIGSI